MGKKEVVFDEGGQTVEETEVIEQEQPEAVADPEENQDPDPDLVSEAAPADAGHKYRIGDKTFATQAEAWAYAEAGSQSNSEVDAYRQVLREVVAGVPRAEPVTQPVEENAEEIFTNTAEFLSTINQSQASKDADQRVWLEFQTRHPELADFREEITNLAGRMQPEVQAVAKTKGQSAAYDYVATKFKAQVERQAAVLRPKRALSNTSGGPVAGGKVETVTSKMPPKKASTMADEIRNMRKGRI